MALSDLKEKFEDFKTNVQMKISGLKSKKGSNEDEDFEDEEYEDESEDGAEFEEATSSHDLEDDEFEDEEEDEGPTKKQKVIRLTLVAIIVAVAASEFVPSEEEDPLAKLPPAPKKKKVAKKPPAQKKVVKQEETKPAMPMNENNQKQIEDVANAAKEAERKQQEERRRQQQARLEEQQREKARQQAERERQRAEEIKKMANNTNKPMSNGGESENNNDFQTGAPTVSNENQMPGGVDINQIEAMTENKAEKQDIMNQYRENPNEPAYKKILAKIDIKELEPEEVIPPEYASVGRGLVYNCEGKHWACVNRTDYFKCATVQKYSQVNGRNPSCVSREVFYSSDHCARGQLSKIHMRKIPTECN